MKKHLKLIAAAVAVILAVSTAFVSFASDTEVKRISCSVYGDGAYGRGFCWYTVDKTGSDLQIVKTADFKGDFSVGKTYSGKVTKYRGQYSHKVAVTDLEPGTNYTYRVGDCERNVWSENCTFVTDDKDSAFSFITIADVQAHEKESFEKAFKTLHGAVKTMPGAEFAVSLGDYVDDNTNEEWDWYFDSFKEVNNNITVVPVAGNHDGNITNKLNTFCFTNTFCVDEKDNRSIEGVYYSFDYGNAHFAVLNTNDMYPMTQAQINWLINDMSTSDATWKIILAHRSFYSAGKNINKPDTIILRDTLLPIIDRLGIDMVFAGHDHMYLRTFPVYGDKKTDTKFVTEKFGGIDTKFALDPEGTVYTLPSTAGSKRYTVNEKAIDPILDVAEVAFSSRDMGGCFCTTQIDGDKLVYKAYSVDDETGEINLIDEYAIKKTEKKKSVELPFKLDQSLFSTIIRFPSNFLKAIGKMLFSYVRLLIGLI